MKKAVLVWLLAVAFLLGAIVGDFPRPHSVAAAGSSVQSWGLVLDDPNAGAHKLLVLYDPATGEIWGYRAANGALRGDPIRIGKVTKVDAPIVSSE